MGFNATLNIGAIRHPYYIRNSIMLYQEGAGIALIEKKQFSASLFFIN